MPNIGGNSELITHVLSAHAGEPTGFPDDSPLGKGDLREPREPLPQFDEPEDDDDLDEPEETELESILDADGDDPDDDFPPPE